MIYGDNKVLKRSYRIGDFSFTLGITRKLAVEGISKYPKYWELTQNKTSKELMKSKNIEEFLEKNPDKLEELYEIEENSLEISEHIVRYLLPKLLEKGETILHEQTYEEYSKDILDFCEENEILYDYFDNEEEENVLGLISTIMEFINLGFTQGQSSQKPKIKIMTM